MRTVVLGEQPIELQQLIERRRATGADLYDEVWNGEFYLAPAPRRSHALLDDEIAAVLRPLARRVGLFPSGPFNLGELADFRVPDRGLHRDRSDATWMDTAALVVEIVSPDDGTWTKLPFYAAHGVDEVVIVDPRERRLTWMRIDGSEYRHVRHSTLLDVTVDEVADHIDWPPVATD